MVMSVTTWALPAVATLLTLSACTAGGEAELDAESGATHPNAERLAQPSISEPTVDGVTLVVGHCFVELVTFNGQHWGLPLSKQFGWGGGTPKGWVGSGQLVRLSPNRVRYDDRGGASRVLLPADDPKVAAVKKQGCD